MTCFIPKKFPEEVLARTKIPGSGVRGRLYTYRDLSPPGDSCVMMGSDESRFNVSLTVRDKATKRMSVNHKKEESRSRFEPMSFCLPVSRFTSRPDRLTTTLCRRYDANGA